MQQLSERFTRAAATCARWVGSPLSFALHLLVVVGALVAGPLVGWEVTMVTLTTLLTVTTELIAVLIANTQQRSEQALHLKLDELVRAQGQARNAFMGLEHESESARAAAEARLLREREE